LKKNGHGGFGSFSFTAMEVSNVEDDILVEQSAQLIHFKIP